MGMPRLFDCFCFFNEVDLLRLRLETLDSVVDTFVIVESCWEHSGRPKPYVFDPAAFSQFRHKIRYIQDTDCPGGKHDPWRNENHQRNQIIHGLSGAAPEDLVLVSDLDEIPNPDVIRVYDPTRYRRGDFEQLLFGYKLNNLLVKPRTNQLCFGTKITTHQHFNTFFEGRATSVRHWKSHGPLRALKRIWFQRFDTQVIPQGGWHFSWVMPEEAWKQKFLATAHQEHVAFSSTDLEAQINTVASGRDLAVADRRYECLPVSDPRLPPALRAKPEAYRHLLLPLHST